MFAATASPGQTVAEFTFDTIGGNSNFVPGDLVLHDVSGSEHDLKSPPENSGHAWLTSDVAGLMPDGTLSLDSNGGGANGFSTQKTEAFHRGVMGELSVEFWWKSVRLPPASFGYVMSFDGGGDESSAVGDWGIYSSADGNLRFFEYSSGSHPEVAVGPSASDGNWHHVAFTIDKMGILRAYLDGKQVTQTDPTGAAASPRAGVLKFGRNSADSYSDHHFRMDDLRISSVALAPGQGSGANELAWKAPLSKAPNLDARPAKFGRHWVRTHPFTITSWGFTSHPDLYVAANFNSVFGGEYRAVRDAGVTPMFLGDLSELDDRARTRVKIALNAGVTAILLRDEMPLSEADAIKAVADYVRSVSSDTLLIVGLGSSTPSYVDPAITGTQPDAVIHGFYPFNGRTAKTDQWYAGGLSDVALVRERALFYDLPYFAFVQSFEDFETGLNPPDFARRLPSESELRAELFSKLSAGVKGFAYFVFEDGSLEDAALVSPAGVKTSLYEHAASANREIAVLGNAMRFLESTDWRFVSGGVATTPTYMEPMNTSAGSGKLRTVSVDGTSADRRDALVGFFQDDSGGEYCMLVNTFHGDDLSADDARVSFTLGFEKSVRTVWRFNRHNGEAEELPVTRGKLNLTLPGGTGDLFKFDNGDFPTGDQNDGKDGSGQ